MGEKFKPKVYNIYRQVNGYAKMVGTISMDPDGSRGKLWLNMFDEVYLVAPPKDEEEKKT